MTWRKSLHESEVRDTLTSYCRHSWHDIVDATHPWLTLLKQAFLTLRNAPKLLYCTLKDVEICQKLFIKLKLFREFWQQRVRQQFRKYWGKLAVKVQSLTENIFCHFIFLRNWEFHKHPNHFFCIKTWGLEFSTMPISVIRIWFWCFHKGFNEWMPKRLYECKSIFR